MFSTTFLLNTLKKVLFSTPVLGVCLIFFDSKHHIRCMKNIVLCSLFSALSNEILFKKIRCKMTENEVIKSTSYFFKKQKSRFRKNCISVRILSLKNLVAEVSQ